MNQLRSEVFEMKIYLITKKSAAIVTGTPLR